MNGAFEYQFEWDQVKARLNEKKHGVSFERAAFVFSDPRALSIFDKKHSDQEDRWITMGLDQAGILVVVCHTFQHGHGDDRAWIRIISARKAAKKGLRKE